MHSASDVRDVDLSGCLNDGSSTGMHGAVFIIITRGALGAKSSLSDQILACGNDDPFQLRGPTILLGGRYPWNNGRLSSSLHKVP